MINSELEHHGDPCSQLSDWLLSSIIKAVVDAVKKPSDRTFVLQLLIDVRRNHTLLGNGCMESGSKCLAP
jgi:hypothetical protein